MIFKMYADNMGGMKIAKELTRTKRLNASGIVKWDAGTVMRILGNATYKGYIGYNKSRSNIFDSFLWSLNCDGTVQAYSTTL